MMVMLKSAGLTLFAISCQRAQQAYARLPIIKYVLLVLVMINVQQASSAKTMLNPIPSVIVNLVSSVMIILTIILNFV